MIRLKVWIEVDGSFRHVGDITGTNSEDSFFRYADEYINDKENRAISISLPLNGVEFSPLRTKNFFEGLLPEGFTRSCVARWIHADENDYISILIELGKECLGAIKIEKENDSCDLPRYRTLSDSEVEMLAKEGASKSADIVTKSHLSLTGASGKVGLYFEKETGKWYQPIGSAPSTHIVKQSHVRLRKIVVNEQLSLLTAKKLGIEIPESFIVKSDNSETDAFLFATERYDRRITENSWVLDGLPVPLRLHQEDFAQALGISANEKYEPAGGEYLKRAFDLLLQHSSNPIEDQLKLWDVCIFNYLIGNTDNHIKNISLLYSPDMKQIRLAPAYDIISTLVYPSSTENMAFAIGGQVNIHQITRASFEKEASLVGLGKKTAMEHFDEMNGNFQNALSAATRELTEQGFEEAEAIDEQILQRRR